MAQIAAAGAAGHKPMTSTSAVVAAAVGTRPSSALAHQEITIAAPCPRGIDGAGPPEVRGPVVKTSGRRGRCGWRCLEANGVVDGRSAGASVTLALGHRGER